LKYPHFLIVGLTLYSCSTVYGGGFEGSGIGARALSMGGAFVGLADDWTASFWNPAGLAFQKGLGFGESTDFLSLRAMDGNGIANPVPPFTRSNVEQGDTFFQLGGEPTHFGVTDTTIQSALPSIAGFKTWKEWSFSAGVFSPLGFEYDINDRTVPGLDASYKSEGYVIAYNLSVARLLSEHFSVGVGVNILDARLKRDASKQSDLYTYNADSEDRGQALQGVFSLLAHLNEKFSLGMVYKTGANIKLDGTSTVADTQFPLVIPGMGTLQNEASRQQIVLLNPAIYTVGMAFHPITSLTLTTDWEGTDWTPMAENVQFDQPGIFLQDQDFNAGWRFTNRIRAGGEYRWETSSTQGGAIRWGYTWDPSAVPDSGVSITNFVDVTRNVYTLGLGWHFGPWEPDLGFAYATGSRTVDSVAYKQVDRLLSAGVQYHIL
jgi:long-chain fatty acid transport protein